MKLGILSKLSVCFSILMLFFSSCSDNPVMPKPWTPNFRYDAYNIVTNLDWSQRWYTNEIPLDYVNGFPHDEDGIIMGVYNGEYYYQPFIIADNAISYLNSYRATQNSAFLELVYRYANKLTEIGDRIHGGIYMPYSVSSAVHGSDCIMVAPWYSGFAQGFALSLYSRIYEVTGDIHMRALADSVFTTFTYTDSSSSAWTCMVDSADYYWIEEYPSHPPEHVFNGFMFAIFGLHDYYMITHNPACATLFQGSCSTIASYFDDWRNPGGVCCYCLKHRHIDPSYHLLVTSQLRQIALITGDSIFSSFADTLYSDYH